MKNLALSSPSLTYLPKAPWKFLVKITGSVFCAEAFIMLLFLSLPKLPDLVEAFLDATLLSLLIAPALYMFVYQPLTQEIFVRSRVEFELRQSQALLERQAQDLEEMLKKLQQAPQLLQAEKMSSLGRLVAGVAHEINNPINFVYANLTPLKEYTQDLLELVHLYEQHYPDPEPEILEQSRAIDLEFLQEDVNKILNSMRLGCERIRQLVLSLRNFSRTDESDFKLVDIHEGIESTLTILQHRFNFSPESPDIQLIKDYGQLPKVACFPGQLNQVFMNILANAIDALEEGVGVEDGPTGDSPPCRSIPTITIQTSTDSQWIKITIADNGLGMPEKVREKIFEPFFTTKSIGKGTGIGLSISYQLIVENHAGKLSCLSSMGKGTEFVVQIPIR